MSDFPLPGLGGSAVVVAAPAPGPGNWVGASSATFDDDGGVVIAYRVRTEAQRGTSVVIAHAADGEHVTTVAELDKATFAAESLERPALVRTESGRWRLYVSCATPDKALAHRRGRSRYASRSLTRSCDQRVAGR